MECAFADLASALFLLGTLENVSIHVAQRTISLTDENMQRVKDAWPHLTSLAVSFDAPERFRRHWQPEGVEIRRPSLPTSPSTPRRSLPRSSKMAVERFLANQDVVHELCQHFSLLPRPITSSRSARGDEPHAMRLTLASMALTCKALSDPASETLWAVLHVGLLPLVKTLSGLKRGEHEAFSTRYTQTHCTQYYDLDGELSPKEGERFDCLAARVRCLQYFHCTDPFESSLVAALASHCKRTSKALLPNLQALHWPESLGDENTLQMLRLLCTADTLHLFFLTHRTKYGFSGSVSHDLLVLSQFQTGLKHFRVDSDLPLAALPVISTLRALRTLRLTDIDGSTWRQLGTLPFLTDLSVDRVSEFQTGRATSPHGMQEDLDRCGFPALQRLKARGPLDLLTTISSPCLTALSLLTEATRADELLHLLEKRFALQVVKTLREVHLTIDPVLQPSGVRMEFLFADLARALLPLSELENVSIHLRQRTISFTDEDVQRVNAAWPHLTSLALSFDASDHLQRRWLPAGVEIRRPSFRNLVEYALSRPGLRTLDVEVAGVSDDDVAYLERAAALRVKDDRQYRPPAGLTWLTFARGDYRRTILLPRDLDRLANALSDLFPGIGGLERASMRQACGRKWYINWSQDHLETEVGRLLQKLECLKSS
ncbi:hypothetical protein C8Q76DRAFT_804391 [Earliella scabrosa]|nr:hypothetical protein C8Q76DRAFT_804391 [Earliella scabrosa]